MDFSGKLKRTHPEIPEIPALVKNPPSCFWSCCSERDKKRHIVVRVRVGLAGMGSNGTIVDKSLTVSTGYCLSEPCIEFQCPLIGWCTRSQRRLWVTQRVDRTSTAKYQHTCFPHITDHLTECN